MNEKNKDSLENNIRENMAKPKPRSATAYGLRDSGMEADTVSRENAMKPKSVEIDGQKVEQHSLLEQIKVDEYLAKKRAMRCKNRGLKIARMKHSGSN
jgi:hypothetical protein